MPQTNRKRMCCCLCFFPSSSADWFEFLNSYSDVHKQLNTSCHSSTGVFLTLLLLAAQLSLVSFNRFRNRASYQMQYCFDFEVLRLEVFLFFCRAWASAWQTNALEFNSFSFFSGINVQSLRFQGEIRWKKQPNLSERALINVKYPNCESEPWAAIMSVKIGL